jgi:hypothetical protein
MTTSTRTALLALLSASLLAACGKPLLYAELEIPVAEVTLTSQPFPSTVNPLPTDLCPPGVGLGGNVTCLQRTFGFDLGDDFRDLTQDATSYDLRLTDLGITLQATQALQDFGDVLEVVVGVDGSAIGLPSVELAAYRRSAADPNPTTIVVAASSNVDLGPYLEAGRLALYTRMQIGADTPEFTADVVAQFYLKALLDYGRLAGIL